LFSKEQIDMQEQRTTLYYCAGGSDKVYSAELVRYGEGYVVNFSFGRRGAELQTGSKTPSPLNHDAALRVYERLVKEKTAKGYTPGKDGTPYVGTEHTGCDSGIRPQLLNPIKEDDVEQYLDDPAWWMQEKYDGKRLLLRKVANGVIDGINRRGLNVAIPEPVRLAALSLKGTFVFDGEIVGDTYYIFDCLERNGNDLRNQPYSARYDALPMIQSGSPIEIAGTIKTNRHKRLHYIRLKGWNVEGVVFKRHDAPYTPDRPSSGGPQLKCKFYATASLIVAAINKGKRSVAMEAWELDRRVKVGSVTIPPNVDVPQPGDVVEVRYLYAYPGGSLYQPTFILVREDVLPAECGIGQLKFKKSNNE